MENIYFIYSSNGTENHIEYTVFFIVKFDKVYLICIKYFKIYGQKKSEENIGFNSNLF